MIPTDFSNLKLSAAMLSNLNTLEYKSMTPVQAQSLPEILQNRDVIVQAKTGSGKTAAFGIGVLNKLDVKKFKIQTMIICPTRELADQVAKELRRLARFQHNVKILMLYGGTPFNRQVNSLRHGAHIVVGTPGRLIQHISERTINLEAMDTLVLDEADRMLDMGFFDDIKKIISNTPTHRQTLLFSATYPDEIMTLSKEIQKDAISIKTISQDSANKITEYFYKTSFDEKLQATVNILSHFQPESTIIFCNTKIKAQELADDLQRQEIDALAIHGDLEQFVRTDVLVQFSNHSCPILVATDVAARGLDVKELSAVINYDIPHDSDIYTHRIGRTGRAGQEGLAFTLYVKDETEENYGSDTRIFEDASVLYETNPIKILPPNITLVIEGGKKDKVRPGDILGALTAKDGLEGKDIGKIDIYDRQSYVAIARQEIDKAFKIIRDGKVKGRNFSVWILK
ncbi:MAG: ATP-dependent RNA helicase DbpA [Campylobacterota bacterium]|nr:ATP-dependent RNA helicase DbpA [Campylobacterota bacterium]